MNFIIIKTVIKYKVTKTLDRKTRNDNDIISSVKNAPKMAAFE